MPLRLLADENVPGEVVRLLSERGFEVTRVRQGLGLSDHEVLEQAQREHRVILTFDKDFGELAFARRLPADAGVILVRALLHDARSTGALVAEAISSREDWQGHFAVIEEDAIRITRLPGSA